MIIGDMAKLINSRSENVYIFWRVGATAQDKISKILSVMDKRDFLEHCRSAKFCFFDLPIPISSLASEYRQRMFGGEALEEIKRAISGGVSPCMLLGDGQNNFYKCSPLPMAGGQINWDAFKKIVRKSKAQSVSIFYPKYKAGQSLIDIYPEVEEDGVNLSGVNAYLGDIYIALKAANALENSNVKTEVQVLFPQGNLLCLSGDNNATIVGHQNIQSLIYQSTK